LSTGQVAATFHGSERQALGRSAQRRRADNSIAVRANRQKRTTRHNDDCAILLICRIVTVAALNMTL
jgi:hypothetical protein